jgi:hypothetical protein
VGRTRTHGRPQVSHCNLPGNEFLFCHLSQSSGGGFHFTEYGVNHDLAQIRIA